MKYFFKSPQMGYALKYIMPKEDGFVCTEFDDYREPRDYRICGTWEGYTDHLIEIDYNEYLKLLNKNRKKLKW